MKASSAKVCAVLLLALVAAPSVLALRIEPPTLRPAQKAPTDDAQVELPSFRVHMPFQEANRLTAASSLTWKAGQLCNLCIQMAAQGINYLLNVILNSGVVGSCAELCDHLPKRLEAEACQVVCDAAGIYGFIQAIKKADLDPIYFCELTSKLDVNICPIQDCPAATPDCQHIQQLQVAPTTGPVGTDFKLAIVMNGTAPVGTGEIRFSLCPPGSKSQDDCNGQSQFTTGFPAGQYGFGVDFDTSQAQGKVPVGEYTFSIEVCEGLCGPNPPRNPHEYNFGTKSVQFTVTPKQEIAA